MTEAEMAAAVEKAANEAAEATTALAKAETDKAELAKQVEQLEKAAKNWKKGDPPPWTKDGKKTDDNSDDDESDDVSKADLSPAVRARLEKLEKAEADANQRLAKAEEIAKAEQDLRITREYVAKASEFRALPIEPATFGPVLKAAAQTLSKEDGAELERVLKAADEQIRQSGLFKEAGASGDGQPSTSDSELTRKADEIRKADTSVSQAQAMTRAMSEHPELAARYLDSVR